MKYIKALISSVIIFTMLIGSTGVNAATKTVNVTSQAALEKALASGTAATISIKPVSTKALTVPEGDYGNITLVINSAKATVNNYARFKTVTVSNAKAFNEFAKGNSITISGKDIKFTVKNAAEVKKLSITAPGGKLELTNNGTVSAVNFKGKCELDLCQNGTMGRVTFNTPAEALFEGWSTDKLPITVKAAASGSKFEGIIPVQTTIYGDCEFQLGLGAEKSTFTVKKKKLNLSIVNGTSKQITVTGTTGTKTKVKAGKSFLTGTYAEEEAKRLAAEEEAKRIAAEEAKRIAAEEAKEAQETQKGNKDTGKSGGSSGGGGSTGGGGGSTGGGGGSTGGGSAGGGGSATNPTPKPTQKPSGTPSPSNKPTPEGENPVSPVPTPSEAPTGTVTPVPSEAPAVTPTAPISQSPTGGPTSAPKPTAPVTSAPTEVPTTAPEPTAPVTSAPTEAPTSAPEPTASVTSAPTEAPTSAPEPTAPVSEYPESYYSIDDQSELIDMLNTISIEEANGIESPARTITVNTDVYLDASVTGPVTLVITKSTTLDISNGCAIYLGEDCCLEIRDTNLVATDGCSIMFDTGSTCLISNGSLTLGDDTYLVSSNKSQSELDILVAAGVIDAQETQVGFVMGEYYPLWFIGNKMSVQINAPGFSSRNIKFLDTGDADRNSLINGSLILNNIPIEKNESNTETSW